MANDFSNDPNCVALWRFESGALTMDSKGSNTLTDANTVQESTGDYKEGSCAADLEGSNNEFLFINDADVDSGFPLKIGDSTKKISVCGWFKMESFTGFHAVYSKFDNTANKRSLILFLYNTDFYVQIGYNGGASAETLYNGGTIQTGRWYHFGFTFDDSDKSWKLVIWDDTAGSKIIDTSGTATNNIHVDDAPVGIGCSFSGGSGGSNQFDGLIDEVPVFKDILATAEIDEIRQGVYNVSGETTELVDVSLNLSAYHQDMEDLAAALSAYYQDLEDFAAWLRAHDGLEFEDFKTLLAAYDLDLTDLPTALSAYHQDLEDFATHLQTWAWRTDDVKTLLSTQGLSLNDLPAHLRAVAYRYEDVQTFLKAVDSTVLTDLAAYLAATDGTVLDDVKLYLAAIALVPAYRAVTAQRLTSVISEVS